MNFLMKSSGLSLSFDLTYICDQKSYRMSLILAVLYAAVMV